MERLHCHRLEPRHRQGRPGPQRREPANFGYFALTRSIPAMDEATRRRLEDFAFTACDAMYGRDERTGFQSIKTVWSEMGWDAEQIWRDTIANSQTVKM
ncbi:MAG TPA: hypothetical protein VJB36_03070, partial [Methylomirabilota bacterium]|nr:hypothetical protein [Methylomirabilota bacterium]